ncbi:MAG: hypothetical protein NTU85_01755 [Candidatus Kaiserbacteria bacterium]|nr:hypothetical protein [Candidatus Kaiserbacteria bacterium]
MESGLIKKYLKYIGGLIVVILILQAVGYFIYKNVVPAALPEKNTQGQGVDLSPATVVFTGQPAPEKPFDFKGTLYLSLKKINGNFGLGIYTFNINGTVGSKFTTIFADRITKDGDYNISISPSVSSDGKKLAFARGKVSAQLLQIFTSDISGTNAQQITNTPDKYKREPVFNPSGKLIAYISHKTKSSANDPDPNIPESWSTYVTDLKGNVVKIAAGVNPIFSPDGKKLLILQNDGLHAFDIRVWTNPKHLGLVVKTVGGRASEQMKISVSTDGRMMSWSSENTMKVVVSHINSWDTFSISPFLVIKTKAYWSVFSPDGKYLAVDEWRKDSIDGTEYPVIMGYDLSNGKSVKLLTLISDDKSYLWFGAWK